MTDNANDPVVGQGESFAEGADAPQATESGTGPTKDHGVL
jgi:hypothetical protein